LELLLDTQAFLWWLADDPRLGPEARSYIEDPSNLVHVSAASAWEIAVKRASGKLEAPGDITAWIGDEDFRPLPIAVAHAVESAELPEHHRDPFDRLLVAQARLEGLTLVARDDAIERYDVAVIDAAR
jgi:PIN domain nuclease of toxin-antitoxin system